MKTRSYLPRFFRRLFGVLEVFSAVMGIVICVAIMALPRISDHAELLLGEVGLMPEPGGLTVLASDSKMEAISIKNVQGILSVKNPGDGLLALIRWYTLPLVIAYAGFIAVLLDLFRRLFRNVERGESFTERSVRLVHKIGITVIVFTLLSAVAASWHNHAITTYLERHATIQGIKMAFTAPSDNSIIALSSGHFEFHFGWGGILTGLLILALGEVFRQGLALKEDNELTV